MPSAPNYPWRSYGVSFSMDEAREHERALIAWISRPWWLRLWDGLCGRRWPQSLQSELIDHAIWAAENDIRANLARRVF